MDAWRSYAREVSAALGPDQRRDFREALLARAEAVASAAGGFAGMGKTSPEERRVIETIESALG
jgi:hypothetical protein